MISRRLRSILKLIFGFALIMLLFVRIDLSSLVKTLITVPLFVILLFFLDKVINIFMGTMNVKILSDTINKIRLGILAKYYWLSWTIGMVSPGKIGEFSILFFLKKHKITLGEGLAISIIDKMITLSSLMVISSFIFYLLIPKITVLKIILIVSLIIFLMFGMIISDKVRHFIKKYLIRKHSSRLLGFNRAFRNLIFNHNLRIFINFFLTVLKWLITSFITFIAVNYMGQKIGFISIFIIVCASMLISMIPISINGLGIRQLTFVGLMGRFGVSEEVAFSLSILSLMMGYLVALMSLPLIKSKIN
ncbi:hypothetical protein GF323_06720 [Candidatus Woesearchaeota archaeon]|nr:hypothetical protein [Candidatus Woesearchaeota archaeon]